MPPKSSPQRAPPPACGVSGTTTVAALRSRQGYAGHPQPVTVSSSLRSHVAVGRVVNGRQGRNRAQEPHQGRQGQQGREWPPEPRRDRPPAQRRDEPHQRSYQPPAGRLIPAMAPSSPAGASGSSRTPLGPWPGIGVPKTLMISRVHTPANPPVSKAGMRGAITYCYRHLSLLG